MIIFLIYYILFLIKILPHIHFYESKLYILRSKLYSYRFKYSYSVTIMSLVTHFSQKSSKSHITNLMNYRDLPELFQHVRLGTKIMSQNPKEYYHISAKNQGYDGFSFNKDDYLQIITEKNISLITFYEKKMLSGDVSSYFKIKNICDRYSVPKLLSPNNLGLRPCPVDHLEIGAYSYEYYYDLLKVDLSQVEKPATIHIENYSHMYEKIVWNHKRHTLVDGTIINDEAFEHLEYFYSLLEKNEEMCLEINDLLDNNPLFPLSL